MMENMKRIKMNLLQTHDFEYGFRFNKTESNFKDLWLMISCARESLKDWLISMGVKPEKADDCANACSELVENAIKFSAVGSDSVISLCVNKPKIIVETLNRTQKENVENASQIIRALNDTTDIRQLMAERLLSSDEKSQLGLMKSSLDTEGKIELIDESEPDIVHLKLTMEA